MKKGKTTSAALAALCVAFVLPALTGCDELAQWRNSQIQSAHKAAQSAREIPPAQLIVLPDKVRADLPVDESFIVFEYAPMEKQVSLRALSCWDLERTAIWVIQRLEQLGYDSGENPSLVLEGAEFVPQQPARYSRIYMKVSLNTAGQVVLEISANSD